VIVDVADPEAAVGVVDGEGVRIGEQANAELFTSFPDGSNCRIGGLASPRFTQVAWPGGTVLKQRWNTQTVPSLAT
jgi:hypothetical protein